MAKVIELKTLAGQSIYVEVDEEFEVISRESAGGTIAGGREPAQSIQKLEEVGLTIADVCATLQDKVIAAMGKTKPAELTLEFGVKLAGEAGIPLVTKGSVEGTLQVIAKWDFSQK